MDSALLSRVSPEGARLGPSGQVGKRKALPITEELTILIKSYLYILDSKFFSFFRNISKKHVMSLNQKKSLIWINTQMW